MIIKVEQEIPTGPECGSSKINEASRGEYCIFLDSHFTGRGGAYCCRRHIGYELGVFKDGKIEKILKAPPCLSECEKIMSLCDS